MVRQKGHVSNNNHRNSKPERPSNYYNGWGVGREWRLKDIGKYFND